MKIIKNDTYQFYLLQEQEVLRLNKLSFELERKNRKLEDNFNLYKNVLQSNKELTETNKKLHEANKAYHDETAKFYKTDEAAKLERYNFLNYAVFHSMGIEKVLYNPVRKEVYLVKLNGKHVYFNQNETFNVKEKIEVYESALFNRNANYHYYSFV